MSKVYADAVTSTEANQDLTLGGSGDNVIVTAGATLKTNTVKDSGGNTLWTSDGSGTVSSVNSAISPSNMVLLSTQTASNAASLSFTSGINNTYRLYIFKFIDINPVTDNTYFTFQGNVVGQTGYNETIHSTFFSAYHDEADGNTDLQYETSRDQAQGTAYQYLIGGVGSGADECCAGELYLFAPSSTTYVKNFYSRVIEYYYVDYAIDNFCAGYFNVTAAIDDIQFKMDSGNFDGTIALYGISKS